MDAKADDWVVTPRMGKPVEIQALWYNLLVIGAELEVVVGGDPGPWRAAAAPVPDAFRRAFWDPARGYLADVIARDGVADWSLRPNQLFALSLPHPLVDAEQARSILSLVRAKLNTPRGLRSLDPAHPDYHPRYLGDRRTRDGAYHQGTVWGWLHGPYMEALLRYEGEAGRREARALLEGWAEHLGEACLGQASEVFDGEAPHTSRGCFAQAWTVAELLRIARRLREECLRGASPPRASLDYFFFFAAAGFVAGFTVALAFGAPFFTTAACGTVAPEARSAAFTASNTSAADANSVPRRRPAIRAALPLRSRM
jgi:glycogen debranching enzyme